MASSGIKLVFGAGAILKVAGFDSAEKVKPYLDILKQYNVTIIDTANGYGESEDLLGQANAAESFSIDTKNSDVFTATPMTKANARKRTRESLKKLNTDQVDVFYLHAPDHRVPMEETLSAVNSMYDLEMFQRFGISNFSPEETEQVMEITTRNNWVKPSVYQGSYNAVSRLIESDLIPLLRKHDIAFYAYSPIAGGFLARSPAQLKKARQNAGRWHADNPVGKMYYALYGRPSIIEALNTWGAIAADEGVPQAELAYRWVTYHSKLEAERGDAVIFAASSTEQLAQTLEGLKRGPLSEGAAKRIDEIWPTIQDEAPIDNIQSFMQHQLEVKDGTKTPGKS